MLGALCLYYSKRLEEAADPLEQAPRRPPTLRATMAVMAVAMTFAAPMALAQTADVEAPSQAAPQVTDQQLEMYAVAALEVQKINQTYQPKINKAPTREDQEVLYDEATQEMTDAIRDGFGQARGHGLQQAVGDGI